LDKLAEAYLNIPSHYKYANLVRAIWVMVFWLKMEHEIRDTFIKVQGHHLRHVWYDQLTCPSNWTKWWTPKLKPK
jgi:hypothetical protein